MWHRGIFFDVACALDLDNQNDRDAQLHAALDLTAQGAIVVLAIFRVLDNLVMGQVILKIRHRHKVVVDAVLLALARARVVAETVCWISGCFFSSAATTVSLPVPEGPETTNRYFSPFIVTSSFLPFLLRHAR